MEVEPRAWRRQRESLNNVSFSHGAAAGLPYEAYSGNSDSSITWSTTSTNKFEENVSIGTKLENIYIPNRFFELLFTERRISRCQSTPWRGVCY